MTRSPGFIGPIAQIRLPLAPRFFAAAGLMLWAAGPLSAAAVSCSDLTAVSATSGWSTVQKDKSIDQKPITLGGKVYAKGLGTHAPSEIVYTLNGKYLSFTADVGLDDETAGKGSVEFQVFADDSLLFKSGVMKGNVAAKKIDVSLAGRNKLRLVTTIGGDTYDMDDADWAGAQLMEPSAAGIATLQAPRTAVMRKNGKPGAIGFRDGRGNSRNAAGRVKRMAEPGPER